MKTRPRFWNLGARGRKTGLLNSPSRKPPMAIATIVLRVSKPRFFMRGFYDARFNRYRSSILDLFHAVIRIPGALQLADVEDLSGVVGVVGADVGNGRGDFGERCVVGVLDKLLERDHDGIKVVNGPGPR